MITNHSFSILVLGRNLNLLGEELNDNSLSSSELSLQSYRREREFNGSYGKTRSSCSLADLEDGCHDYSEIGKFKHLSETKRNGGGIPKTVYKKTGKMIFTTRYSEAQKTLTICIIKAFDLVSKTPADQLNCFIRAYLQPDKQQKYNTKYHKGTTDPLINEKLVFRNIEKKSFCKYKLCFKAYHCGKLKTNDLIGEVEIALSSVNPEIQETFHVDFLRMRKKVFAQADVPTKMFFKKAFLKTIAKFTGQHLSRKQLFYRTSTGNCFRIIAYINISKVNTVEIMAKRKNIQVKNFEKFLPLL